MKLIIANKNYSSWSMRPWVLMTQLGIAFDEVKLVLDTPEFHAALKPLSPVSKVPLLVTDSGFVVWESLAIVEFLAEEFPALNIWPRDSCDRARARSLCSEMHAGFNALRRLCPMNVDADLSSVGPELLAKESALAKDLARFDKIASERSNSEAGPYLFGEFSAADAFYAPVVIRITRYGLPTSPECKAYLDAVCNSSAVSLWVDGAVQEKNFLETEEVYRKTAK